MLCRTPAPTTAGAELETDEVAAAQEDTQDGGHVPVVPMTQHGSKSRSKAAIVRHQELRLGLLSYKSEAGFVAAEQSVAYGAASSKQKSCVGLHKRAGKHWCTTRPAHICTQV